MVGFHELLFSHANLEYDVQSSSKHPAGILISVLLNLKIIWEEN